MSPNNQYLCIVPDRSSKAVSAGPIYLPFEGDEMLSIVLSKALLRRMISELKIQSIRAQIDRSQRDGRVVGSKVRTGWRSRPSTVMVIGGRPIC